MDTEKKPNNPGAFPSDWRIEDGMTLRDYFANSAMQSILNHKYPDGQQLYELREDSGLSGFYLTGSEPTNQDIEIAKQNQLNQALYVAKLSYLVADAMLKQREL